jgi:hypothetical protein
VQLLYGRADVREAAAEAVEGADRYDVHASATRVEHQAVKRRPPILRTAAARMTAAARRERASRAGKAAAQARRKERKSGTK